jgi:hypothetical protein
VSARLIDRPDVRQMLLAQVAKVAAGQKLNIARLRDALVDQGDVLAGIQALIDRGQLDPVTLRPPVRASGELPSGSDLHMALLAYAAEHRIFPTHLSLHLFGCTNGISQLPKRKKVFALTRGRIAKFLAGPPPAELLNVPPRRKPRGIEPTAEERHQAVVDGRNSCVTGADLAAAVDALIAKHGLLKSAVGRHLLGSSGGVEQLRKSRPRAKTIAFVRAFLANPPIEQLKSKTLRQALPSNTPGASGTAHKASSATESTVAKRDTVRAPLSNQASLPLKAVPPVARQISVEPQAGPRPTWMLPAERAWCTQCEVRVSGVVAAKCMDRWCKVKGSPNG